MGVKYIPETLEQAKEWRKVGRPTSEFEPIVDIRRISKPPAAGVKTQMRRLGWL